MAYPIKYIENNLVFNHDGECFAYYELLPYNYSFLSPEQKYQVHDSFRQLIAQNRDGKIHALQISTESSIRAAQERSKQEVTGKLKDVACTKIDAQTEALISMIGENQVDYRFFIGFKLLVNEHVNPFMVRYAWQLRQQLDVKAMNEAAELLLGTHDFSAFRSSGSVDTSPIKTIYAAKWQQQGEEILFRISGDGFLYHMVRNIVWSLVQVGMGKRTVQDFAAELTAQRCEFLNEPAPAQGLYLAEVGYREYPQL